MARRKSDFSAGKRNIIIAALLQEYDIQSADDIQDTLKDLLGGTIQSMLEAEMDNHLGYEPYERTSNSNARNGKKTKSIRSKYGEMNIRVPQDRESSFEPQIVQNVRKIFLTSMIRLFPCMPKDCQPGRYRSKLRICQLIIQGMLITTESGDYRLAYFVDEQRMCRLYEKFILEYYSRHFPKLPVSASQILWALDDGLGTMLPVMQSDIHLQKDNTALIIDAKYYNHTTQVQYDKHTLHSNNLYQIFTYVKNRHYEFGDKPHVVSEMLLYAKTE